MKVRSLLASAITMALAVVVLLPINAIALNSPLDGTYETQFDNIKSNGETVGCSLVYKNLLIDQRYEQGRPLILIGSITVNYSGEHKYYLGFKIGVNEPKGEQVRALKIKNPYLESRAKTHKAYKVMDGESANYKLAAYEATGALVILPDIFDNKLGYGFAIGDGASDLNGLFDFTVESRNLESGEVVRSQEMLNNFTQCALGLNDKYIGYLKTNKK